MKHSLTITLTVVALIGVSPAFAATAANPNGTDRVVLPDYTEPFTVEDIAALPVPTHNPIPQVSKILVGTNLKLKFIINEKGRPESVRLEKPLHNYSDLDEMTFASQMRDLVAKWKFEPARNTVGDPVSVKAIMPVHVVKKGSETIALASLILDTSSEDRS